MYCLTSLSETNHLPPQSHFQGTKSGVIAGREIWTVWTVTENLPLEFLQECRNLCWPYEALHCREAVCPHGWASWSFRFDRLAKGGQGLRVTLGIHCCPALQEVYQKGAVLIKEERQHNLSCTCVDGLGFFGDVGPGWFHWKLCRFDSGSKWWHQDSSPDTRKSFPSLA